MLFSGIWAVIKPWLDSKTKAKITIIGSGYKEKLNEFVKYILSIKRLVMKICLNFQVELQRMKDLTFQKGIQESGIQQAKTRFFYHIISLAYFRESLKKRRRRQLKSLNQLKSIKTKILISKKNSKMNSKMMINNKLIKMKMMKRKRIRIRKRTSKV